MALLGSNNLDAINTAFETAFNKLFGEAVPGTYSLFTKVTRHQGTSVDIPVVDISAGLREWKGSRHIGSLRAHKLSVAIRNWERTTGVDRDEVDQDRSGAITERLQSFLRKTASQESYDKVVLEELLANPTGYDGVSLLNDSHPFAGGGSQDNLSTNALSQSELDAMIKVLRKMKSEDGEPLNVDPTHLLVGPDQEEKAKVLTDSKRPVAIDEDGKLNQGSSGVGSSLVRGFADGKLTVLVSPRIGGNEWFLMDLSKEAKPMGINEFRKASSVQLTDPKDPNVFERREYIYGVDFAASPFAGDWHLVGGSVTS